MSAFALLGQNTVLAAFLIFCRIGACLMVVPGFSSTRIPAQIRLFVAFAVSLAVAPVVLPGFQARLSDQVPAVTLAWIVVESLTGFVIGLLGRIFLFVLESIVTAMATAAGFGVIPGTPLEGEPVPGFGALLMLAATALTFAADLHWELVRGIVDSYDRIPPGSGLGAQASLVQVTDQIGAVFVMGLRIGSPFIAYSIVVNLALGFANKLTPQVPVFFIATPFLMAGGLLLLYATSTEFMTQFLTAYASWLRRG
ncbi:flagellar biosynthesis protein FliR [Methylobacterium oryzihabitans]|uniref:Flagellar biosynthesis protein FliR n=1 Tax=Methylobacterium oryzihabitans TaxID=2499852 RepID=A0A437PDG8_9HYPH|nr:flagellar biosynthesis protein FliR [Methylobacterium oryzihabitans]